MKLRIGGNSIRLRLLRSEVARLHTGASLHETLDFGDGACLAYALVPEASTSIAAHFANGTIVVRLPQKKVAQWASSEQVGIYQQIALADGGTLAIAIEKDFACLDRSDADNEDTFAHPNADAGC